MSAFEPASKLFNLRVHDARGEFVGWVSELLMDLGQGQIEYVLITLPAARPCEMVQVTVPWSIVRTETRRSGCWSVSVKKTALQKLAAMVPGP